MPGDFAVGRRALSGASGEQLTASPITTPTPPAFAEPHVCPPFLAAVTAGDRGNAMSLPGTSVERRPGMQADANRSTIGARQRTRMRLISARAMPRVRGRESVRLQRLG